MAILALVYADTLRREVVRDYACAQLNPVFAYSPVYWSDTGEVYVFLPLWRFWGQEEERYELVLPKFSHIVGKQRPSIARGFPTPEEAVAFFGQENASPLASASNEW